MCCAGCFGKVLGKMWACAGCGAPLCQSCMQRWNDCAGCHKTKLIWGGRRHLAYLKKYNKGGEEGS